MVFRAQVDALLIEGGVDDADGVEEDRAPLADVRPDRVVRRVELKGVADHPVLMVCACVAERDLIQVLRCPRPPTLGVVDDHERLRGQVVEDGLHALVQQGLEILDARGQMAAPQRLAELIEL